MRNRLIFRVDDIGYTPAYDMGAFEVFDLGIGSAADVMFDAKHTVEALNYLKQRPWLSIGWHRHLWERPVLPVEEVPSLVDEEGRFKWRHRRQDLIKEATYEDAYKEFDAQMKLCYEILKRYPDSATLRFSDIPLENAFRDIVEKYNIPHNIFSSDKTHKHYTQCNPEYAHLKIVSSAVAISSSYRFEDFSQYDPLEKMTSLKWEDEEVIMVGWHPGYCDDYILAESTCNIHRCRELQAAKSDTFRNWIIENKIELTNQKDILNNTNTFQEHLRDINSPLWVGNFK